MFFNPQYISFLANWIQILSNSLKTIICFFLGKAINSIFQKPESVFIKAKVKDILFDGLPIDCTVTDFAGSAVCTILKEQAADLVKDGENKYLFSFFGGVSIIEHIFLIAKLLLYIRLDWKFWN